MRKVTIQACADIALVKYWGKKDEVLRLPENGSFSMMLDGLTTTTSVEFDEKLLRDEVTIDGEKIHEEQKRVVQQLDRVRELAHVQLFARVTSQNSFPKSTGLSSSSSAFAALTVATTRAAGLMLTQKELSILARQGSGSACRCVCGGFVEWHDGETSETSFAETFLPAEHWDLRDIVAIISNDQKNISSSEAHQSAQTSPFFTTRVKKIPEKIANVKTAITEKNFPKLGEIVEAEALEFHSILLTSQPPLVMWYPGTVQVMYAVHALRKEGVLAYFTINTGFNIHVLTLPEFEQVVAEKLKNLDLVQKIITSKVGNEPKEL